MVSMGTWVLGSCILKTCPSIKRNHNFYLVLFWLKVSLFHLVGSSFQDGVLVGSRLGREVFSSPTKMLKVILEDPTEFARIKDIRTKGQTLYLLFMVSVFRSQWGDCGARAEETHRRRLSDKVQVFILSWLATSCLTFVLLHRWQLPSSAPATTPSSSSPFPRQLFTVSTTHRLLIAIYNFCREKSPLWEWKM